MNYGDIRATNDDEGPTDEPPKLEGVFALYQDDQLDECIKRPLEGKKRVRYNCMDIFADLFAFGTSSGAIYLYQLEPVTRCKCSLISIVPCDQGSIEAIKFLTVTRGQGTQLLIAIGTLRGSCVVLRLNVTAFDNDQGFVEHGNVCTEIYKAQNFTARNSSIKFIENDLSLVDPSSNFSRLYICDSANRLYELDINSIYANENAELLPIKFFSPVINPSVILSADETHINQISAHRARLLISTDETTRIYNGQSNQLKVIGTKERKVRGFYGACFFHPDFRPCRFQLSTKRQHRDRDFGSATFVDSEPVKVFVARTKFRLWQASLAGDVEFTHQFDIESFPYNKVVELHNQPLDESFETPNSAKNFAECFETGPSIKRSVHTNHFQRLIPIHSATLGNLLLSHSRHEIVVIDPVGARLITWYSQRDVIEQVCCSENEIFIRSSPLEDKTQNRDARQFSLRRIVLLAPTQLVLELHRLHRYLTLISFVEMFSSLFCERMALPLGGPVVITTEGGLLRNVLLNAWDKFLERKELSAAANDAEFELDEAEHLKTFRCIVAAIVEESKQLKQSLENLDDSRFFLAMTHENIDRLGAEPYRSLVSLEVSIVDLHTSQVIHFSKEALNRHKSTASLSENIHRTNARLAAQSNVNLNHSTATGELGPRLAAALEGRKVIVERKKTKPPKRNKPARGALAESVEHPFLFSRLESETRSTSAERSLVETPALIESKFVPMDSSIEFAQRCTNCRWPRPRAHMEPLNSSQTIQLNWMKENLMADFQANLAQLEKRSFEHGLWRVYLRCLTFRAECVDFVTCCALLDDVRLLNEEPEATARYSDDEMTSCIMDMLRLTINPGAQTPESAQQVAERKFCLKCNHSYPQLDERGHRAPMLVDDNEAHKYTFVLINVIERYQLRRFGDIARAISQVLKHPDVLNRSYIPINFYLKVLEAADLAANQTPSAQVRINQLHGVASRARF